MLREAFEETGLTLTDYQYRGIVTFVSDEYETEYMHLFTASAWSGEMTECNEGILEWVPKNQVPELPIWEGDKIFFAQAAHKKSAKHAAVTAFRDGAVKL